MDRVTRGDILKDAVTFGRACDDRLTGDVIPRAR
jgi:hypothetical protein